MTDHRDYDLSQPLTANDGVSGLRAGLTSYGDAHFSLFLRKVFIKAAGYSDDALSRPIVGIINTFSAFNPCHANVPQLIEAVKRGVHLSGGLAIEFPTISVHESFSSPTSMFLRNLMSMDTEEMIKAQPMDVCVMIGGCDKTVPAQLMGALSANKPVLPLLTGPMMSGSHRGQRVGACTDCRSSWAAFRAGEIDIEEIAAINEELAPTVGQHYVKQFGRVALMDKQVGTCGVMGTASTMACIVAGLGLMPLRGASAPAVSSARLRVAESTGSDAVSVAKQLEERRPQSILSRESFLNAIIVLQAIGGSTNAVVHLMAIINRHPTVAGTITLQTFDDIGRKTPLLVDLKPSGDNYMDDFHNAGGMIALLHTLRPLLYLNARTITGETLGQRLDAHPFRPFTKSAQIIRPLADPITPASALVVLRGNLAPNGAIMKAAAIKDKRLAEHVGPAVVFSSAADLALRIDNDGLEVTPDSVLVLQSIGPIGHPGMPEAGMIPIPRKLAALGVRDMLRLSDGRMSGTAGGSIVLHISPEAGMVAAPFGVVRDGDQIRCSVSNRALELLVDDAELQRRIAARKEQYGGRERIIESQRGYRGLYEARVNQAEHGADFDFLTAHGVYQEDQKGDSVVWS